MHGFSALRQVRRPSKAIVIGSAVLLLAGVMGGTALARATVTKGTAVQFAATYYTTATPGGTGTSVTWPSVGQASLASNCFADWDPATGEYGVGMKAIAIKNSGKTPIAVAFGGPNFKWLQPGQADAFLVVGQVVNNQSPNPKADARIIAILARGGTSPSATGTFAWSARWQPSDHTGHCAFTLQMKG